ncbi:SPOSA6832_05065, partial [Sporobolomyces salmonicolor]
MPFASSAAPSPSAELSLVLLGTGTSSALPSIGCLTSPETGCWCCRSTLTEDKQAKKNIRRNTSAVLRIPIQGEEAARTGRSERVILVDCGKTFFTSALEHWPRKGLREIDAVILTHAHASSIPIYCTQETFVEIDRAFPYLTSAGKATGGGDIPALTWHIFSDSEAFDLLGPYFCMGFLFDAKILYLSDVSYIPEEVWSRLSEELDLPFSSPSLTTGVGQLAPSVKQSNKPRLQALVVDCLRIEPFTSHFGLGQAVQTATRLGADKTYLRKTDRIRSPHLARCLAPRHPPLLLRRAVHPPSPPRSAPSAAPAPPGIPQWEMYNGHPDPTKEDEEVFAQRALQGIASWVEEEGQAGTKGAVWVRPAVDGMTICVGRGSVWDDEYPDE